MAVSLDWPVLAKVVLTYRRWKERKKIVHDQEYIRLNSPMYNRTELFIPSRHTTRSGGEHLRPAEPFRLETLAETHKLLTAEDLEVGRIHKGGYLLCRAIAQPCKSTGTHMIVEDVNGSALRISIYNLLSPALLPGTVSWALTVGDVFAIVEPFYKVTRDGEKTIRCDNPSHFSLRSKDDKCLAGVSWAMGETAPEQADFVEELASKSSMERLAREGKRHFKEKRFVESAKRYRESLLLCETSEDRFSILSNLCECMIRLGHYRLALRHAQHACKLREESSKARERRAKVFLNLSMLEEALRDAGEAVRLCPSSRSAKALKAMLEQRFPSVEPKPSSYDFADILEKAEALRGNKPQYGLLLPDYIGPEDIRESPGRGRGLFATRRIPAGELIIAEKALGAVYRGEVLDLAGGVPELFLDIDTSNSGRAHSQVDTELTWRLMQASCENCVLASAVNKLHGGRQGDASENTPASCASCDGDAVDVLHTEGVIRHNAFGVDNLEEASRARNTGGAAECYVKGSDKGLWNMASFFNHSCMSTCNWFTILDFVFVCASRDVDQGEELTISYMDKLSPYSERQKVCESFGFQCKCEYCQREKRVASVLAPLLLEHVSIVPEVMPIANLASLSSNIGRLRELSRKIEEILPPPSVPLSRVLHLLGRSYEVTGEWNLAAETMVRAFLVLFPREKGLKPLAFHFMPIAPLSAALFYSKAGKQQEAQAWFKVGMDCAMAMWCQSLSLVQFNHYDIFAALLSTPLMQGKSF